MILWGKISQEIQGRSGIWVVVGDFNDVRVASDRLNSVFNAANARRFNDFITDLIKLNVGGGKYAYKDSNGSNLSKIDRFFVNTYFISFWSKA